MTIKEQLENEILRSKCRKGEREISDNRYAWQKDFSLVQKIVFTLISLIMVTVIVALINVVIK